MLRLTNPDFELYIAQSYLDRARGLIRRENLIDRGGLLICNCNWVHSLFMTKTTSVFFLDENFLVLSGPHLLKPWRFSLHNFNAKHTLEVSNSVNSEIIKTIQSSLIKYFN
ncbi:MAG: DUF192 domain-containing protein [bacterium]|nr:DUF192 domain-containing protein [bacterium]